MFTVNEHGQKVNSDNQVVADVTTALAERGVRVRRARPARSGGPGDLDVELSWRDQRRRYLATVSESPTERAVATRTARGVVDLLLLARYVSPSVARRCRDLGVHYADAAGNAYLDWGDFLLDVEGRRATSPLAPGRADRPLRAFQPSGLRVVFVLLARPELVTTAYRDIAEASGVSVGSVHWVMAELVSQGYVEKTGHSRRLHRTSALFDRWVEAYVLSLEPRLVLGRYDTDNPAPWMRLDVPLDDYGAQWGGESAASMFYGLVPGTAVVYVPAVAPALLRRHRLRKVPRDGLVVFRERFWVLDDHRPMVPMPLVYADLVASGDPRQIEAARWLRQEHDELRRLDER
jgi:hypothetical protein